MMKWRVLLAAAVFLGFLGIARSADDRTKVPDARQTTEKFLAAALAGKTKEAAALGEPGKSYNREEKIKEFEGLNVFGKKLALTRVLADDQAALAITEKVVETKRGQEGPLSIRLVKKDNRWLIRDVDFGEKSAAKNMQRFQREHPKAKPVDPKKDK
ncbi:MAG TPA: hypothetical protein VH682_20055 [Gemmataceae bacterium]|jgi:hypothetical protein